MLSQLETAKFDFSLYAMHITFNTHYVRVLNADATKYFPLFPLNVIHSRLETMLYFAFQLLHTR